MNQKNDEFAKTAADLQRVAHEHFTKELDHVITESETVRLQYMQKNRTRKVLSTLFNLTFIIAGVAFLGWQFVMHGKLAQGAALFILAFLPAFPLYFWSKMPVAQYKAMHKTSFMPKLAKAFNGMQYYPNRGVSEKIVKKLPIFPRFDRYDAEDCFVGQYKDARVMFSEARLYSAAKDTQPVFQGLFVLLEMNAPIFTGHTIITADRKLVETNAQTRWKKLSQVKIPVSNRDWDIFDIFSTSPAAADMMIGDDLLKELAEAAKIFDNAPLTAALFGQKYVFIAIPNDYDMFEASDMFMPVTTKVQAEKCQKEIERILEILDIFDLYKNRQ